MRIALLTSQWPGVRLGGIGVYTVNCARGLALAGHEVHVFAPVIPADAQGSFPSGVFLHQVDIHEISELPEAMPVSGDLLYRRAMALSFHSRISAMHNPRIYPKCVKVRFDIVELPEYEGLGQFFVGKDSLGEHIPFVTHLHSASAVAREAGNVANEAEQALREAIELEVIAGSDGVCAPSRSVIEDTQRAYGMDDLASEAQVIPLPVDMPNVEFTLPEPDAPVLYVGRLELLKGAHLLAEAAVEFLGWHPQATLRVVGPDTMTAPGTGGRSSGHSMAQWMRERLTEELASRVIFLGERTRSEIEQEMKRCAFVVCPSLRESYSFVCCEALAIGRPVVVSSGIGATDVVGKAGLIFARGDAEDLARVMGRMWDDRDLREHLSKLAWERAETELSPERAIELRVAFYKKVIEHWKKAGTRPAENRLSALPTKHSARMSLASGEQDANRTAELMKRAELEGIIVTPGARAVQQLESRAKAPANGFYLYGAGRHTAKLLMEKKRWESKGYRVIGLIDDHPRFQDDPRCYGLPVISCTAAAEKLTSQDLVILSTDTFEDQFWTQTAPLRAKGITVLRLYA